MSHADIRNLVFIASALSFRTGAKMADVARKMPAEQHYTHVIFDMDGLLLGMKYVLFSAVLYYGGWLHSKSISLRPQFYWPRAATLQLGILPLVCPANKIHIQIRNNIQIRRCSSGKYPALLGHTIFSDENQFTLI